MYKIRKMFESVGARVMLLGVSCVLLVWFYNNSMKPHDLSRVEDEVATSEEGTYAEEIATLEDRDSVRDKEDVCFVPVINIDLNGVTLEEINANSKNIKYGGNGMSVSVPSGEYFYENVQIKGRGNATWGWKKKPYQITLPEEIDLFGLGAAKKWVLLANYRDVSLLRNASALYLAENLGEEDIRAGIFVELYVDHSYVGLYYMTHKVEIGHSVVDLSDEMGVLVEIEAVREPDDIHGYSQYGNICVVLKEAVEDDHEFHRQAALDSFMEALDRLEAAAIRGDWTAVQKEIDVDSFVRYFLISEFSANPDAFATSFYMHRDGMSDVIHAGPIWDFDMAFANPKYTSGDASSPNRSWAYADPRDLLHVQNHMAVDLFQYLMDISEFRAEVEKQYRSVLRTTIESLPDHLYTLEGIIRTAALRDQEEWHETSTVAGDLEALIAWIKERGRYMDLLYGSRMRLEDGMYEVNSSKCLLGSWCLEQKKDGSYQISDPHTGRVLSMEEEGSIEEYEPVVWKEDSASQGQRWILASHENGVVILSKLTGLALTFEEDSGEMNVQEFLNNDHQILQLMPIYNENK